MLFETRRPKRAPVNTKKPTLKIVLRPKTLSERGGRIRIVLITPRKNADPINPILNFDSQRRSNLSALTQPSIYSSSLTGL